MKANTKQTRSVGVLERLWVTRHRSVSTSSCGTAMQPGHCGKGSNNR